MQRIIKLPTLCLILAFNLFATIAIAEQNLNLLAIKTKLLAGGQLQILLKFSATPPMPTGFTIANPSKMIFDFAAVKSALTKSAANQHLSSGIATAINFVTTTDKTRMIIEVVKIAPYTTEIDNNNIIITLNTKATKTTSFISKDPKFQLKNATTALSNNNQELPATTPATNYDIQSIDFHRGEDGAGKFVIELATEAAPIDFYEADNAMIVEYQDATIPKKLLRKFDVRDFGTPIQNILVTHQDNKVQFKIQAFGNYDKVAYQLNKQYIIEAKPISSQEKALIKAQKFKFTGEKISLNFQDIEVRAVLQLLADFTGLNIIASDSVTGNITLRLDNIPWDQALDFILKTKGLGKRESGNIIMIAPNTELAEKEQQEAETLKQAEVLTPLQAEFIQINYAKAADLEKMLNSKDNSILSERGTISIDERTNTLLITDTADKLANIRKIVEKLDIPIKQVLIEAQVVQTNDDFTDAFGINFGGASKVTLGKYRVGLGGDLNAARRIANTGVIGTNYQSETGSSTSSSSTTDATGTSTTTTASAATVVNNNLPFFNLEQGDAKGKLGLAIGKLPGGTLLDLELRASELEAKGKVLARPKLMTLDQQTATIETGTEIPYTTTAQEGSSPSVTFKKAVLKLEVKPQITPNNKILMELTINQDKPGNPYNGQTGINTTNIKTNILVDNGETVVLGGVFTVDHTRTINRIPFFSSLPIIGWLFSDRLEKNTRKEILIFVTPKIIKQAAINQPY